MSNYYWKLFIIIISIILSIFLIFDYMGTKLKWKFCNVIANLIALYLIPYGMIGIISIISILNKYNIN